MNVMDETPNCITFCWQRITEVFGAFSLQKEYCLIALDVLGGVSDIYRCEEVF